MGKWTRLGVGVCGFLAGCGNTVVTTGSATTGSGGATTSSASKSASASATSSSSSTGSGGVTAADKVDIVFMIDNSSSMADKQQILGSSVRDLLARLMNPVCVDASGALGTTPTDPTAACAMGYHREFTPVSDINLGIVDSSLGGMGSDACPENTPGFYNDDKGELVSRSANNTPTYMNQGFLAFDAKGVRQGMTDPSAFVAAATSLVIGVGEKGCGYEQQLEAVTRFLVVPHPYDSLAKGSGGIPPVFPAGEDAKLEAQRAAFLRPDSLLLVVVLTDENDFSINWLGPQNYAPWNSSPFYRASSTCATNPADPCCYSCGLGAPTGASCATPDPSCQMGNPMGYYSAAEDEPNLKESQPKKHYGFNPNFPVKRYVNAFSRLSIDPTLPDLGVTDPNKAVQNPIFADLSNQGRPTRDPSMVFFTAIVGVPYQAVARDPSDLSKGLKSYDELSSSGFFSSYVGDPDGFAPPANPIMQESTAERGVGPGAPNGGDRSLNTMAPGDLQYACIFPFATPNPQGNDCFNPDSINNPLCTGGSTGAAKEPQINAKAYPSLRELAVAGGLEKQGIIASICPANVTDPSQASFGYRPAMNSIVDRLAAHLK